MKKIILLFLIIIVNSCSTVDEKNIIENKNLRLNLGKYTKINVLSTIIKNEKMIKSLKNEYYCDNYFPIIIKNKSNTNIFIVDSNKILYNRMTFKYENDDNIDSPIVCQFNQNDIKTKFDLLAPNDIKTYYLPIPSINNAIGKKRNPILIKAFIHYIHQEKEPKKPFDDIIMKEFVLHFSRKPNGKFQYIKDEDTLIVKNTNFYFYSKYTLMN